MVTGKIKGYLLGILAAASYGTNPLFALPLYEAGLSADSVLFLRYLAALPVLAFLILLRGQSFAIGARQAGLLVGMGLLVAVSSLTLFMSYNYMDVGIASSILFVYPVMVACIMGFFFHERLGAVTLWCIAIATAGIGLMMKTSEGALVSITGVGLSLLSALSYAIYIVAVNKTSLRNVPTLTVTFYVLLFGVVLFLARLLPDGQPLFPSLPGIREWGCVAGLAILPTAMSFACTTGAIQSIGSTPTAILGAFEPVTAVLIGVFVFGEILTPQALIGLLLVVAAVTFVVAGPGIRKPVVHVRKLFPRRWGRAH